MKRFFSLSRFLFLILSQVCFFQATNAYGQSDRPCSAPFLPLGNCASTIPIVLTGRTFQAGDAPIPGACNLPYSVDVWARVVAPSADFSLSYITRTFGFTGASKDPSQINVLFYQESPDCNSLVNPIGCQVTCPLALVCITLDGMEGASCARRFVGLTPGNTYYMRLLWNPSSAVAPDSVRINLADISCNTCDPCGGNDVVLDHHSIRLNGQSNGQHIALDWEAEGTENDVFTIQRSLNSVDWDALGIPYAKDGISWSAKDLNVQAGNRYFYRIQQMLENGETQNSEVIEVQVGTQEWLTGLQITDEAMVLQIALEADASLKVYDLQGRLRFERNLDQNESEISIPKSELASGLLLLSLTGNTQGGNKLVRAWN